MFSPLARLKSTTVKAPAPPSALLPQVIAQEEVGYTETDKLRNMPPVAVKNSVNSAAAPATQTAPVLFWLVVLGKDSKRNLLLDDSMDNRVVQSLKAAARESGIKVALPAMDIEDITKITADDICGFDAAVVKSASVRYGAKNIVVGCITTAQTVLVDNEGAKTSKYSEWLLITDEKDLRWKFSGQEDGALVSQTMQKIAQLLGHPPVAATATTSAPSVSLPRPDMTPLAASRADVVPPVPLHPVTAAEPVAQGVTDSSVTSSTPGSAATAAAPSSAVGKAAAAAPPTAALPETSGNHVTLRVTNVNNLDQYAAVVKHLHTLPQISRVELLSITSNTVKLNVAINGGLSSLTQLLASQHQFTPLGKGDVPEGEVNTLSYSWVQKVQ